MNGGAGIQLNFIIKENLSMKKRVLLMVLACLTVAVVSDVAQAAVNGYIKIGDIKGESDDQDHKDWIIIESMASPIYRTSGMPAQGKAGAGQFSVKHAANVNVSPALLRLILSKRTLDVPLDIMEGGQPVHFVFTGCRVSAYSLKLASSGARDLEDISFTYQAVRWTK
jgi:type VI protein secretion system component Hcp